MEYIRVRKQRVLLKSPLADTHFTRRATSVHTSPLSHKLLGRATPPTPICLDCANPPSSYHYLQISAGYGHTCGILSPNADNFDRNGYDALCWGAQESNESTVPQRGLRSQLCIHASRSTSSEVVRCASNSLPS